jgi:ABC-type polysaccharide/polyol phosphate export permease/Tfp pilus assembly protein PilF
MASSDLDADLADALSAAKRDKGNLYGVVMAARAFRDAAHVDRAVEIVQRHVPAAECDERTALAATRLLRDSGSHHAALPYFERLLAQRPSGADFRLQYAQSLLAAREFRTALDQLEIFVAMSPDTALGWRNHAGALEALGEFRRALRSSTRAVELDGATPEYHLHRAGLLNHLGRTADALAEVAEAERLEGQSARVFWFNSIIHDSAGDLDSAIAFARRAAAADPGNLDHRQYAADLERRRQMIDHERQRFEEIQPQLATSAGPEWGTFDRSDVRPRTHGLRAGALAQGRVILALLRRDAQTRFGETRLGYLWALLEPVAHLFLMALVFSATQFGVNAPLGESILVYYFTGVLPYLLFANTIFGVQQSLNANRFLLQIPLVQHLDILLSRGLLELVTQVAVAVVILTVFNMIGLPAVPYDWVQCLIALFFIWLLALGVGMTNAVILHFVKSWELVFATAVRAMYFVSGIFINPLEMPDWVRDVLVWNPVLQGVDWVRSAFFQAWQPVWLDRGYLVAWGGALLLLAVAMERAFRKRLTVLT